MRDYKKESRERQPLVLELAKLGIPGPQIAQLTGWSLATIHSDATAFGGRKQFCAPLKKGHVFRACLLKYSELHQKNELTTLECRLIDALENFLQLTEVHSFLLGLSLSVSILTVTEFAGESKKYEKLIDAIFGTPCNAMTEVEHLEGISEFLKQYFANLTAYNVLEIKNAFELKKSIVAAVVAQFRKGIKPIIGSLFAQRIESVLADLSRREEFILRCRYGIGVIQVSADAIGAKLDLSATRVCQIERKALCRLRHPSRSSRLIQAVQSIGDVVEVSLNEELVAAEKEQLPAILSRSIDTLEFSVRTANCLQNFGIKTIGELVQKSEHELLRSKNFGRKSLKEIKEALGEMGLRLNMTITA